MQDRVPLEKLEEVSAYDTGQLLKTNQEATPPSQGYAGLAVTEALSPGFVSRESSFWNTDVYEADPKKDDYINEIAGEQLVADFHCQKLDQAHIQSVKAKMMPGTVVLNLKYAHCSFL